MNSVLTYIRWIKDKPSFNPDFVIPKFLIGKFYCILVACPAPNELGIEHSQCFGVFLNYVRLVEKLKTSIISER